MRLLLFSMLCLVPFCAHSIDDELVIKEMARKTGIPITDIRANYKSGCDSGVQSLMNICASFYYNAADMELNETYQALMKQLTTKTAREKLIKAQRAWIAFRDLECEYSSDGWSGGSGHGMIVVSCYASLSKERTAHLKEHLNCTQPSCPGEW
jgi:uncharacterized protein YecT (DUF1311 family)